MREHVASDRNSANLRLVKSLNDWWALAGVDCDFHDETTNWLDAPDETSRETLKATKSLNQALPEHAPDESQSTRYAAPPADSRKFAPDNIPVSLDAFQQYWTNDHALDADYAFGPRIAPRGAANAKWFILSDMPDRDDSKWLMTGRPGNLMQNILEAAGIEDSAVYYASVLPWHVIDQNAVLGDLQQWRALALHHIGLVAPQNLVLLGKLPNIALTQNNLSQNRLKKLFVNHKAVQYRAMASLHPRLLLDRPGWKAQAWQDWQFLTLEDHE